MRKRYAIFTVDNSEPKLDWFGCPTFIDKYDVDDAIIEEADRLIQEDYDFDNVQERMTESKERALKRNKIIEIELKVKCAR
jgi:hypothetical protein